MTIIAVREMGQAVEEAEAVVAEAAIEFSLVEASPVIEPANGPIGQITCQQCLEVRDFKNFFDPYHQDDE